jgi:hypothetical protein
MTTTSKVLLVVASPRGKAGVSHVMASYFGARLATQGLSMETVHVSDVFESAEEARGFLTAMSEAETAFFFFPLYADQLPGILVRALELYDAHRVFLGRGRLRRVAALCNCGFPEAGHIDGALAVMRRFAELQGLKYSGGLAFGGGGMVQGAIALERQGGKVERLKKVLNLSADAVAKGLPLPEEAMALVRRPVLPHFLYAFIAEIGFRWHCYKRKVDAMARPFQETAKG